MVPNGLSPGYPMTVAKLPLRDPGSGVRMPNQPTSEPMGVSSLITPQSWPAALPVLSYQTWLALAVRKRLSAPFWPGVKVMLLPFLLRQCPAVTTVSAATSEPVHRPVPPACVV